MSLALQTAELGEGRDTLAPFVRPGPTPGRSIVLENQSRVARWPRSPAQSRALQGELGMTRALEGCARPRAHPRAPALTSAARTARSRRLPRAVESLRDLLRKSAPGEGLPRERAENPHLTSGSTSPVPGTPGRGHNGPPALHASSPVRAPCTPAGSRHQAPGSARPPSVRDIRPGRAPLRAEDGASTGFTRAQLGLTGPGASPGPSVDSGRAEKWCRLLIRFPGRKATPNPLHIPMASGAPSGAEQGRMMW